MNLKIVICKILLLFIKLQNNLQDLIMNSIQIRNTQTQSIKNTLGEGMGGGGPRKFELGRQVYFICILQTVVLHKEIVLLVLSRTEI